MEKLLNEYILEECNKLIKRHYDYLFNLEEYINRRSKRYGKIFKKDILLPKYWQIYKGFDPFKVRNKHLLDLFSYTLADRLRNGTYKPQTAIKHAVPKLGGGHRELNIFPIPDSSVSRLIFKSLLQKNVNRFSSYAYAYREERSAHDAIIRIAYD
jgi:retron-type reverse transcriptase